MLRDYGKQKNSRALFSSAPTTPGECWLLLLLWLAVCLSNMMCGGSLVRIHVLTVLTMLANLHLKSAGCEDNNVRWVQTENNANVVAKPREWADVSLHIVSHRVTWSPVIHSYRFCKWTKSQKTEVRQQNYLSWTDLMAWLPTCLCIVQHYTLLSCKSHNYLFFL